jgi:hypothetical protein
MAQTMFMLDATHVFNSRCHLLVVRFPAGKQGLAGGIPYK